MLNCEARDETHFNTFYRDFECWHGVHIIHATISIVAAILFMAVCTVVSLTFFDSSSNSNSPTSRVNSRADAFLLFTKIILVYLYTFFGRE
jgi:hypothetical protein